jgi:hypothetical protein
MVGKLTNKHINFSDSIVMKELEKIAIKDKLIKIETDEYNLESFASDDNILKETGDVFIDAISLASSLRKKGYIQQAKLLEKRALEYKSEVSDSEEDNIYNWWEETGESLLEHAHKTDSNEPLPSSNDYGRIEDELLAQKRILDTVYHEPTGKVGYDKKKLIDEINKIAQEGEEYVPAEKKEQELTSNLISSVDNLVSYYDQSIGHLKSLPKPKLKLDKSNVENLEKIASILNANIDPEIILQTKIYITRSKELAKAKQYIQIIKEKIESDKTTNVPEGYISLPGVSKVVNYLNNISKELRLNIALNPSKTEKVNVVNNFLNKIELKINNIYKNAKNTFSKLDSLAASRNSLYIKAISKIDKFHEASANLRKVVDHFSEDNYFSPEEMASVYQYLADIGRNYKIINSINENTIKPFANYLSLVYPSNQEKYQNIVNKISTNFEKYDKQKENIKSYIKKMGGVLNEPLSVVNKAIKGFDSYKNNINAAASIFRKISEDENIRIRDPQKSRKAANAANLLRVMYSKASNLTDESTFGDLLSELRSIDGVDNSDVPATPEAFFNKTVEYLEDAKQAASNYNIKTSSDNYVLKTAGLSDLTSDLAGDSGAAPAGGTISTQRGGGKGRYTSKSKRSDKLKDRIAGMQAMQEDFSVFASSEDIRVGRDPKVIDAIDTAKGDLKGANPDGVWGPNTQASLESIQRHIETNPILKSKINKKLHTKQPSKSESDSQVMKNVNNNIVILAHAQALLGDPKYKKFLSSAISASGYDMIPTTYTPPVEGNEDSFMPDKNGIRISAKNLLSLGTLKGYLDSKGYNPISAEGI